MTDNFPANAGTKLLRVFFAWIDKGVYTLLGFMYEIFFNVASADLFANETILGFYKRVQLIIGVYMVFQLAMLIMKGIFNTETVSGKNNNEFIKRIIIALVMLTVMTPISIPSPQNEYEIQINNNGLLFGTLYSLQYRILNNNTIGRLVLGTTDTSIGSGNNTSSNSNASDLTKSANVFTNTILKGFFRINLVPDEDRKEVEEGKSLETLNANRMCKDIDDDTLDLYVANDTSPSNLLTLVNATCTPDTNKLTGKIYKSLSFFGLTGKTKFVFAYLPLVSTVVGIIFIFIMVSFTIDIAVRAIKLAVLRLIAPIPIISYMDPNGSKDGGFNSWVKTLTQTYLELFIRLASVYFVIYLIQDMIANGIYMNRTNDAVGRISFIFICIGLFYFAKEAPKFLQQAIGMKSEPVNIFGQAIGTAGAMIGGIGAMRAGMKASKLADETRKAFDERDIFGNEINPNSLTNRGKHLLAGLAGGFGGAFAGATAARDAKDHRLKAAMDSIRKRNADAISRGNSGSTFLGRMESGLSNVFTGEGSAAVTEREISSLKGRKSALEAVKSRMSSEMVKKDWTYGSFRDILSGYKFNYKESLAAAEEAKALKLDEVTLVDSNGKEHKISIKEWEMQKGSLLQNNEDDYIKKAVHATFTDEAGHVQTDQQDEVLVGLIADATAKGATISGRKSVTKEGIDELEITIKEKERQNVIAKANDTHSGNS